jgi:hypothetical protein
VRATIHVCLALTARGSAVALQVVVAHAGAIAQELVTEAQIALNYANRDQTAERDVEARRRASGPAINSTTHGQA